MSCYYGTPLVLCFKAFLKPVMYDVVNVMLMSHAKNYSVWDTFARDIPINLTGSGVFETVYNGSSCPQAVVSIYMS